MEEDQKGAHNTKYKIIHPETLYSLALNGNGARNATFSERIGFNEIKFFITIWRQIDTTQHKILRLSLFRRVTIIPSLINNKKNGFVNLSSGK